MWPAGGVVAHTHHVAPASVTKDVPAMQGSGGGQWVHRCWWLARCAWCMLRKAGKWLRWMCRSQPRQCLVGKGVAVASRADAVASCSCTT